jgi:uncharacterized protein (TIGR00661 family)
VAFEEVELSRIIYGVQGEGRGHSSRSKIIIEHLLSAGHEVRIFTSHKGFDYLSQFFDHVTNIMGLGFVFDGDKLDILRTVQKNIHDGTLDGGHTLKVLIESLREFKPDLAITDFEPFVPYAKSLSNVPFLSINHQHVISQYRIEYPHAWRADYLSARAVINNMYWFADHYYVTSFFFPAVKRNYRERASIIGPMLRSEVLAQEPVAGEHILVYVTTQQARKALELTSRLNTPVLAYGFEKTEGSEGHVTYRPPSTEGFLKDAANSRAIITNGGYTLISEALYLGKPIYSIPINRQFEQMLNGYYLQKLGYGLYDIDPEQKRLEMFLEGIPYFTENIRRDRKRFCGNDSFFADLDRRIADLT